MQRSDWKMFPMLLIAALSFIFALVAQSEPQSRGQVKVVVGSQQSAKQDQRAVQGSGSVIIRKESVYPSGRVTGGDRQTTVQRSTGIFTLVQDGGESILSVASQVPYSQTAYYYNYAIGRGYIQS